MTFAADTHIGRNVMRRVRVVKVEDDGEIQKVTVQGLADEFFELSLRGQPHGMSSNPRVGSVGYAFLANGRPDQPFLMGLEHPDDRPKNLEAGEAATYGSEGQVTTHDKDGNTIVATPNGIVHINPPE